VIRAQGRDQDVLMRDLDNRPSSMKILHVSHQQYKYLGARNYLYPVRINNGFVRNGHEVYWFSDRDVARASSWLHSRSTGKGPCNKKFLQACRNFQPDLIAMQNADILTPETIAEARRILPNAAVFQYFIDTLSLDRNVRNIRRKADVVDMSFVTTAGDVLQRVSAGRKNTAFVPNPVDASIDRARCHERQDLEYDVFFAGHIGDEWQSTSSLRNRAWSILSTRMSDIACAFHSQDVHGYLYGADLIDKMTRARIGLNFSQQHRDARPGNGSELYFYSSDRIGLFQGNGLLVFSPADFDLAELYGDDTLVEVANEDDFVEKLTFYLANDDQRRRVARAGYERSHAEFNERLVARYMIEATLETPFSHPYAWPTERY
jgi:hypothetical protein